MTVENIKFGIVVIILSAMFCKIGWMVIKKFVIDTKDLKDFENEQ